jgi:hypothetical protein
MYNVYVIFGVWNVQHKYPSTFRIASASRIYESILFTELRDHDFRVFSSQDIQNIVIKE